eukprot:Gb_28468 [translate_table: standard]
MNAAKICVRRRRGPRMQDVVSLQCSCVELSQHLALSISLPPNLSFGFSVLLLHVGLQVLTSQLSLIIASRLQHISICKSRNLALPDKEFLEFSWPCRTIPRPLTPSILLDGICWTISEPTSTACVYMDSLGSTLLESGPDMDAHERVSAFFDARDDGRDSEAFSGISEDEVFTRPIRESEKREVIYKGAFLTILFPIDRFGEMGLSARTFFSEKGFTRLQILDHMYTFYQENMSPDEIEVAIHTDSKHADRLRSLYASKEAVDLDYVPLKRIEFLGSRRSFEALKRVSRENTGQVYELWLGA